MLKCISVVIVVGSALGCASPSKKIPPVFAPEEAISQSTSVRANNVQAIPKPLAEPKPNPRKQIADRQIPDTKIDYVPLDTVAAFKLKRKNKDSRTYTTLGKEVEFFAGGYKAKIDGRMVHLEYSIVVKNGTWTISTKDLDLVSNPTRLKSGLPDYKSAQEVMARNPELHKRLIEESRMGAVRERALKYNPETEKDYVARPDPEVFARFKRVFPVEVVERRRNFTATATPVRLSEPDHAGVSTWVARDGSYFRFICAWFYELPPQNEEERLARETSLLGRPGNFDEFGAGDFEEIKTMGRTGHRTKASYRNYHCMCDLTAHYDARTMTPRQPCTKEDEAFSWKLSRLVLG